MTKSIKIPGFFIFLVLAQQNINSQNLVFNKDSIVNVLENVFKTDTELRYHLDTLLTKLDYNSPEGFKMYTLILRNDSVNVEIVGKIIDKYGWLGVEETSQNANDALFLAIQHGDLKTQLNYLPLLTQAVKDKKASPKQLALLVDRTNLAQGKFQIYGSQLLGTNPGHFSPILNEPNVNKRRKEIGLEPIEEYAKKNNISYVLPRKDKYLGKLVVEIYVGSRLGGLENVAIYLGNNQLIGKSNKYGRFSITLDKKYKGWAIIFKKEGYRSAAFCIEGKNIDVFTGSYLLAEL